jgi:hypothetical protein
MGGFDFLIPSWLFLYIWSGHYIRDAWGLRPFDHQKYTVVLRPFSVMLRPFLLTFFTFCYFLLLFLLPVTFWNYFLLLKVQCLLLFLLLVTFINYFFYCWKRPGESFTYISSLFRGRGCALIFYFLFFNCWGRGGGGGGWRLVFFFPSTYKLKKLVWCNLIAITARGL